MRSTFIEGYGGARLRVREAGPEDAPAILLIHGWSQSGLCWKPQMEGALAERFRVVAPDLRGHGDSDKPDEDSFYANTEAWAGDIAAVIEALGLKNPLIVGWSMGGKVVADYLGAYGDGGVAGTVFVGSPLYVSPEEAAKRSPAAKALETYDEDSALAIPAMIAFLRACTHRPMAEADFNEALAYNMLCPPHARRRSRMRVPDYRPILRTLTRPVLFIYGADEQIVSPTTCKALIAEIPNCRGVEYPDCGHSPFYEHAERFNRDVAAFAEETMGVSA